MLESGKKLINKKKSKYVTGGDWLFFREKCLQKNIKVLQSLIKILDFGQGFYEKNIFENVIGLGVSPKKFRKARNIVQEVINSKMLESYEKKNERSPRWKDIVRNSKIKRRIKKVYNYEDMYN
jgi:hypothetical protein